MSHAIYLFFNGNCEEAMNFYAEKLGGTIEFSQRYKDAPAPHAVADAEKIMHATIDIGGFKIMCSDSGDKRPITVGDNFSISIDCKTDGELQKNFMGMSEGGTVVMDLQDTFWGAKFGMLRDKFGVNWMFNHELPKQ